MQGFDWNTDKNDELINRLGISFEDVEVATSNGNALDDTQHPNEKKYGHQRILVVEISGYAYAVPYVTQANGILFLKTIYPSRKYTRKFLTK